MQLVVYILAYPVVWLLSRLPFRILYLFSDFVFFLLYTIIGYRKKVVWNNLKLIFPEKSDEELKRIQRKFYGHLCDTFLEMVKPWHMSAEEMKKRYKIKNIEVLAAIAKEKTILVPCAHYANWEWNTSLDLHLNSTGYAVYQKIGNPYFNKLIKKIRGKWHTHLITQQETVKTVLMNEKKGIKGIFGMVSDQSPQMSRAQYWQEFMGVRVPIHNGAEILARKFDLAVVFLKVTKVKRGFYEAEFIPITTSGKNTEPNYIIDTFLDLTEKQIKEAPEYYLWTHRRWKHRHKEHQKKKVKARL